MPNSAIQSNFQKFTSGLKHTQKKSQAADKDFFGLPWHRAECESWWFVHGCPLEDSHRILTKVQLIFRNYISMILC